MEDIEQLKKIMTFKKKGIPEEPLFVCKVNEEFILAVYKGSLSQYDILIKYKKKVNSKWSRIRTPKHIHWAVDILIKMHAEPNKTKEFLDFLLKIWDETEPIKSEEQRNKILDLNYLLQMNQKEFEKYKSLSIKGEYNIKFLILLAELLMLQEKTNFEGAYMFKNLLNALKKEEDIYKIVSIATHRGKSKD